MLKIKMMPIALIVSVGILSITSPVLAEDHDFQVEIKENSDVQNGFKDLDFDDLSEDYGLNTGNTNYVVEDLGNGDFNIISDNSSNNPTLNGGSFFNSFSEFNNEAARIMDESNSTGFTINFSEAFNQAAGYDILNTNSLIDMQGFDTIDFGIANMKYDTMIAGIIDKGLSGSQNISLDSTALFNNVYGDVAKNLKMGDYSMPKNFNTSEMLDSVATTINSSYQNQRTSGMFGDIKNMISIGSCFDQAKQTLSIPELASTGKLNSMITGNSGKVAEKYVSSIMNQHQSSDLIKNHSLENVGNTLFSAARKNDMDIMINGEYAGSFENANDKIEEKGYSFYEDAINAKANKNRGTKFGRAVVDGVTALGNGASNLWNDAHDNAAHYYTPYEN